MNSQNFHHFILSTILCLGLCNCGGSSAIAVGDELQRADQAMLSGSYAKAQNICNEIISSAAALSANELCRLSITYIKLAEQINDDDNTAAALKCFRAAIDQAPDSITDFFAQLSHEDLQYAVLLSNITSSVIASESGQMSALSADIDSLILVGFECDSLPADDRQ